MISLARAYQDKCCSLRSSSQKCSFFARFPVFRTVARLDLRSKTRSNRLYRACWRLWCLIAPERMKSLFQFHYSGLVPRQSYQTNGYALADELQTLSFVILSVFS